MHTKKIINEGIFREVLLFDGETDIGCGFSQSGTRKGFLVKNMSRKLVLKCKKVRRAQKWVEAIRKTIEEEGPGKELTQRDTRSGFKLQKLD